MFHPHAPTGGDPEPEHPDRRAEWQSMRSDAQDCSSTAVWLLLAFIILATALITSYLRA